METSVILPDYAYDDLSEITDYIYLKSFDIKIVEKVLDNITKTINLLISNPLLGKQLILRKGIVTKYRTISSKPYTIFYKYEDNNIFVISIIHSKRDYLSLLISRNYI